MKRLPGASVAFASGLMRVRGVRRQRAFDRGFPLSDHADWSALLATVAETGASRVLVTHGWSEALARFLAEERGLETGTIRTAFEGETGELTEAPETYFLISAATASTLLFSRAGWQSCSPCISRRSSTTRRSLPASSLPDPGPHVRQEILVELRVLGKIGPGHDRAVPGDDGIHVLDPVVRLLKRVADLDAAAPLFMSRSGRFLPEKISPACAMRSAGKTTNASPLVCPRPK